MKRRESNKKKGDLESQIPQQNYENINNASQNKLDSDYNQRFSINKALQQSLLEKEEQHINALHFQNQNDDIFAKRGNDQDQVGHHNMLIPSMDYPNYNQIHYGDVEIHIPIPPPPPAGPPPAPLDNNINMDQPFSEKQIECQTDIRDIKEIEQCNHRGKKHLYVTSPLFYSSVILLFFFLGGLVAITIAVIIIAVASEGCEDCGCEGGGCDCDNDCCNFCDKNCYYSCLNFFDHCSDRPGVVAQMVDYQYYSQKYYRKQDFNQYQLATKSPGICDVIEEFVCCSCFDVVTLDKPIDYCLLNKVEVYCVNCNSQLKEEYTGTKYIFPSISLGIIGFITLGIVIYFYLKFKTQATEE